MVVLWTWGRVTKAEAVLSPPVVPWWPPRGGGGVKKIAICTGPWEGAGASRAKGSGGGQRVDEQAHPCDSVLLVEILDDLLTDSL